MPRGLFAFAGSYAALFVLRLISGIAGGNVAAAQAYIADITSPAERSRGMGLMGAALPRAEAPARPQRAP
ncbi:MAG: MFS transporter [Gemmatimonadales bacterium]